MHFLIWCNMGAFRQGSTLGNHHDPVANDVQIVIDIGARGKRADYTAMANAGIFVDDGTFNIAITADARIRSPSGSLPRRKKP